jgi:hypothetical protein
MKLKEYATVTENKKTVNESVYLNVDKQNGFSIKCC